METWGGTAFQWGEGSAQPGLGTSAFSIFPALSDYYPGTFMVNFRVAGLEAFLEKLKAAVVRVDEK